MTSTKDILTEDDQKRLERELQREVESWVDRTFNYIDVSVYEKLTDNCLLEHIEPVPLENYARDWFSYALDTDAQKDVLEEIGHDYDEETLVEHYEDEIRDYVMDNGYDADNYPMWNTLFEFRYTPSKEQVTACEEAGLGVIAPYGTLADSFNTTLFATSAGHSFYSSYWIPAYLGWNEYARERYKGVKYGHL